MIKKNSNRYRNSSHREYCSRIYLLSSEKMKILIKIGIVIWGVLSLLSVIQTYLNNRILLNNVDALLKQSTHNDSLRSLRTNELILTTKQIEAYFPNVEQALKDMDIKIRKLDRFSSFNSTSDYHIKTKIRDTVWIKKEKVIRDTVPAQYTHYSDNWIGFEQAIVSDSAYTRIIVRDSISIVQSWERPRKFWFIRYGRKKYYQTIKNFNPHSTITHSLNIKKR